MMRTPAQEASDSLLMTSRSVTELTLKMIWPSLPFLISSSISSMMRDFMHLGATIRRLYSSSRLPMAMLRKNSAASRPMFWSAVMRERSVYWAAVFSL